MKKTKRFLGLFLAVLSVLSIIACAKPGPIILKNIKHHGEKRYTDDR